MASSWKYQTKERFDPVEKKIDQKTKASMEKLHEMIGTALEAALEFGADVTLAGVIHIEADEEGASISGELTPNRLAVFLQQCLMMYDSIRIVHQEKGLTEVVRIQTFSSKDDWENLPTDLKRWTNREIGRQEMIKKRRERYKRR